MHASDVADLYVSLRDAESFTDVARSFERRLRYLGWAGNVRQGPPPPAELPPIEPGYAALHFDPAPTAAQFADAIREVHGQGRRGLVPTVDARSGRWRWSGTERDFAGRGLTIASPFETSVPMSGCLFALVPGSPVTPLFGGTPSELGEIIRDQTLVSRGQALVFERIEIARRERIGGGPPLVGPVGIDEARPGAILALARDAEGATRRIPGAFAELDAARAALEASGERSDVLFSRLVERIPLD